MTFSRPPTSGTHTLTMNVSSPATNQQSSNWGSAARLVGDLLGVRAVGDEDPDQRVHGIAECLRRDCSVVSGDHTGRLQLADPVGAPPAHQPDLNEPVRRRWIAALVRSAASSFRSVSSNFMSEGPGPSLPVHSA